MNHPYHDRISQTALRRLCHRGLALVCAFFFAVGLAAQASNRGTVSGVVSNEATGDLLPGALLVV